MVWNYFTPLCCLSISPLINSIWLPGCTKSSCKQITLALRPFPYPKIQFLICIMRAKGGQCLLIIKMHLFTGSCPVSPASFTPALFCNQSQGSGGSTGLVMCSRWAQSLWTDKRRMFMIQRACTSTGESGGLPFTNMTCWRPVIFGIISLFFALWSSYVINTCNVTRCLIITHKFPPFHAFIPGKCKSGLAAGKNLISMTSMA